MALAGRLRAQLEPVGGLLVVAGGPGDAVHLARAEPVPEPRPAVLGRSCHDAAEVDRAVGDACTYVTVSPVYPTDSKPGYGPALGPTGLAALCRPGLPVYALGGVRPATVSACLAAGAYGVAVMGPLHHRPDLVPAYLERLPP
jgi:thiamine-phosphate pyrophosphorylase